MMMSNLIRRPQKPTTKFFFDSDDDLMTSSFFSQSSFNFFKIFIKKVDNEIKMKFFDLCFQITKCSEIIDDISPRKVP